MSTYLVTGGAGFIGSHLVDALVARGDRVRVLDNLTPQVHGPEGRLPDYYNSSAEFILGDVRDRVALGQALEGVEGVFHLASEVGVGQSMYEIERYVDPNVRGTAVLLEAVINQPAHAIKRVVVAASMSSYGEGAYRCGSCGPMMVELRPAEQLYMSRWELLCPQCGQELQPLPTPETQPLRPTSVYAMTKRDQEDLCLIIGRAYEIPVVALRYFNAYGTRQKLGNPYTGAAAIFCSRLANGKAPLIFEDGLQTRDFIHVSDVVQANILAMDHPQPPHRIINVGTGRPISILEVARSLAKVMGLDLEPEVVHRFREGDIRHCFADVTRLKEMGFSPTMSLEKGLEELVQWVMAQDVPSDGVERACMELAEKGLIRGKGA